MGLGTVTLYLQRAEDLGLGWPLPAGLDDAALEAKLFRGRPRAGRGSLRTAPGSTGCL